MEALPRATVTHVTPKGKTDLSITRHLSKGISRSFFKKVKINTLMNGHTVKE